MFTGLLLSLFALILILPQTISLSTTNSPLPFLSACSGKFCSSGPHSTLNTLRLFDPTVDTVSCTSNCESGPNVVGKSGRVYNNVRYDDVPLISALFQVEGSSEIPNEILDLLSSLITMLKTSNSPQKTSTLKSLGTSLSKTPYIYATATAFMNANDIQLAKRALEICPDHHQGYLLADLFTEDNQPCEG
ncbi:hypothetical protein TL16_g03428 [Triparma laevis f. inornata]|uniref:Uncharacterized protein n=2 Tax=Triparma laevis TaxID=1534972 RepID=A0A9W7C597_9STRA|nr:hypothetical protein TL16_g03428 [Triparma laevis f. inornata]GMH99915.1 hypothetical protein TrLO_g776 [Triparma laevis f. longispina]